MSKFVNRVGETNIMKCGLLAEIIHYNNARDITVKFSDGNIRVGVPYDSFKKGILKSTTNRRKNLEVGDKYVSNSGFKYEVVKKLSNNRAVVRFEDGIEHDYCISSVKSGSIAHPSQSRFKRDKSLYIGETYRHTSGELMTIIGYRSSTDIDIRFEDGTIVHNKSYGSFRRGEISKFDKPYRERVIGEKLRAKNGLMMEIIACRSSIDIDIRFEDGVVVKGKR